ncbi:MAG: hypothetical protein IJT09_04665, partial [Abditibacteriota bacterium]|nr:hypothetical protein [Abditibacteriota bacterium]
MPLFSKSAKKTYKAKAKPKTTQAKVVKTAAKPAPKADDVKIVAAAGDAYVEKKAADGSLWAIGTKGIEVEYRVRNGKFYMTGLKNKKAGKAYVTEAAPVDIFKSTKVSGLQYKFDTFAKMHIAATEGEKFMNAENIAVKKGDKIVFRVDPAGRYEGDHTSWITQIKYNDGEVFTSESDKDATGMNGQWTYCGFSKNDEAIVPFEDELRTADGKENRKLPKGDTGFRVGENEPFASANQFHTSNECDVMRIFNAPRDGVITASGTAKVLSGGEVDLTIDRMTPKDPGQITTPKYTLVGAQGVKTKVGGSGCVRLDITLNRADLKEGYTLVRYHVIAYPGTAVLRQWTDVENNSDTAARIPTNLANFRIPGGTDDYTAHWMTGETTDTNQGNRYTFDLKPGKTASVSAVATNNYTPWMGIIREQGDRDGFYLAPDYLGKWTIKADRDEKGSILVSSSIGDRTELKVGDKIRLPYLTFGVFNYGFDNMMRDLYTWQYNFLWDYTHIDWFAKSLITVAWYGDSMNLAQQWNGHTGQLDMDFADYARDSGFKLIWEDAGWSATTHWWDADSEGPDFGLARRYLEKNNMKLIVWMLGFKADNGVMSSKVASWGNFQRRTDGMALGWEADRDMRPLAETFLNRHPRASFHTCSGGSNYAHTFEIQRYTDINYDADMPASDYANGYWSYFELPDKWFDNLVPWGYPRDIEDGMLNRHLCQVPKWGLDITPWERDQMAVINDMYNYLTDKGVVGRWSYSPHPKIDGDEEYNLAQRSNYDNTKSVIIFRHVPTSDVTVYPRGFMSGKDYLVECAASDYSATRTGADLMKNGIKIKAGTKNEVIYFNLPYRPGSGRDKTPPTVPNSLFAKRENNIGFTGMGLYWSPGADNNHLTGYEVARDGKVIARVRTGRYYFDRSEGWSEKAVYTVRSVDGDSNASDWTAAKLLPAETRISAAMGDYKTAGEWTFETLRSGKRYESAKWVPAAKNPSADAGGTTLQEGGAEGYWEGRGEARMGRGWLQAGKGVEACRTYTSPMDGKAVIVGRCMKDFYHNTSGKPMEVRITHNDETVWGPKTVAVNDLEGITHNFTLDLKKGDKVRFICGKAEDREHDILDWNANITFAGSGDKAAEQTVVRINCGGGDVKDENGVVWNKDAYFTGGTSAAGATVSTDPNLFKNARCGKFSYKIPVKEGVYCLRLRFVEGKYDYAFMRPFDITLNGERIYRNIDIYQDARGKNKPLDKVIRYVASDKGFINLSFTPGWEPNMATGDAILNAIEITPENKEDLYRVNCGSADNYVDWYGNVWLADTNFVSGTPTALKGEIDHA